MPKPTIPQPVMPPAKEYAAPPAGPPLGLLRSRTLHRIRINARTAIGKHRSPFRLCRLARRLGYRLSRRVCRTRTTNERQLLAARVRQWDETYRELVAPESGCCAGS